MASPTTSPPPPLFRLPYEIRLSIYELVIASSTITVSTGPQDPLDAALVAQYDESHHRPTFYRFTPGRSSIPSAALPGALFASRQMHTEFRRCFQRLAPAALHCFSSFAACALTLRTWSRPAVAALRHLRIRARAFRLDLQGQRPHVVCAPLPLAFFPGLQLETLTLDALDDEPDAVFQYLSVLSAVAKTVRVFFASTPFSHRDVVVRMGLIRLLLNLLEEGADVVAAIDLRLQDTQEARQLCTWSWRIPARGLNPPAHGSPPPGQSVKGSDFAGFMEASEAERLRDDFELGYTPAAALTLNWSNAVWHPVPEAACELWNSVSPNPRDWYEAYDGP